MRFSSVPLSESAGKILGHNVIGPDGRRLLRKGRSLSSDDVAVLEELGRRRVYVAELEPGDVDEDEAARRVTVALTGASLELRGPRTGRVNIASSVLGVLRLDPDRLEEVNLLEGITLATLPVNSAVRRGKIVATTKILPYAVAGTVVARAEQLGASGPLLWLDPLPERRVGLVVTASPGARDATVAGFEGALGERLTALGSKLERVELADLESEQDETLLAQAIERLVENGSELILLAGETAIQDVRDLAPRALERAGGEVICFGAPVDPGNLLMLGYHGDVPVVGAPGCARSPKLNIIDLVLPRLLVGERLDRRDIVRLGHGGLLEDVPERPMPRSRV